MSRRTAAILASIVFLPWPARAQQPMLQLRDERITDRIHVFSGFTNGNVLAVLTDSGVVLVDAQSPRRFVHVDSALATLTRAPVRMVINTHYHVDHTGGNEHWRQRGAEIVAHTRFASEALKDTVIEHLRRWERKPIAHGALPTRTIDDSARIVIGGDTLVVLHPLPAHTNGDLMVWVKGANVLHTGDLVELGAPPFIDWWAGGTLDGMIGAADFILARIDDRTRVVPGHGPVSDRAAVAEYRAMLAEIARRSRVLLDASRPLDDSTAMRLTEGYEGMFGSPSRAREFARLLHTGMRVHGRTPPAPGGRTAPRGPSRP